MEKCRADPCVYRKIVEGAVKLIFVVHVDDIIGSGKKEACDELHHRLNENFQTENLGELKWYLRCSVERDWQQGSVTIKQPAGWNKSFMQPNAYEIILMEDKEEAKAVAENPLSSGRSKHIDGRWHFIHELVEKKELKVVHVASEWQHADILTKALNVKLFKRHRPALLNLPAEE